MCLKSYAYVVFHVIRAACTDGCFVFYFEGATLREIFKKHNIVPLLLRQNQGRYRLRQPGGSAV